VLKLAPVHLELVFLEVAVDLLHYFGQELHFVANLLDFKKVDQKIRPFWKMYDRQNRHQKRYLYNLYHK
jgi:hypothetical protein